MNMNQFTTILLRFVQFQPESTKVFAIIEKTTKFIASQGAQMEILIKAKQANNPLFDFLNHSGPLNPFYKHMLQVMKDDNYPSEGGQYIPPKPVQHENFAPAYVPQPSVSYLFHFT